ncbi:MAG: hypothetical protein KF698_02165 [Anaerolineales bacterium]|nr:hypothetical protein [Anaerolineales bacterium]
MDNIFENLRSSTANVPLYVSEEFGETNARIDFSPVIQTMVTRAVAMPAPEIQAGLRQSQYVVVAGELALLKDEVPPLE